MTDALKQAAHDPLHLSRILHELAGAASLCWTPRPSGEFDVQEAIKFVQAAIAEIEALRTALAAPQPAASQAGPVGDEWISEVARDIAELDHGSPEGEPNVMLVTHDELHVILERHSQPSSFAPQPAAPEPAQAVPLTDEQIVDEAVRQEWGAGAFCAGVRFAERAHGIKQPGSEAC